MLARDDSPVLTYPRPLGASARRRGTSTSKRSRALDEYKASRRRSETRARSDRQPPMAQDEDEKSDDVKSAEEEEEEYKVRSPFFRFTSHSVCMSVYLYLSLAFWLILSLSAPPHFITVSIFILICSALRILNSLHRSVPLCPSPSSLARRINKVKLPFSDHLPYSPQLTSTPLDQVDAQRDARMQRGLVDEEDEDLDDHVSLQDCSQ